MDDKNKPITPDQTKKNWHGTMQVVEPYVFKIFTPDVSGTGFQISYSAKPGFCAVATAYHVIKQAYLWKQPIKLVHWKSGKSIFLEASNRAVYIYPDNDLAFILFDATDDALQSVQMPLLNKDYSLFPGVELAWCGFPVVMDETLCFFAGHVSAYHQSTAAYLIDGVAINGVSGGPVFFHNLVDGKLTIAGVISNYLPNRSNGDATPGLAVARSVAPYQADLEKLNSLAQAQTQQPENQRPENQEATQQT